MSNQHTENHNDSFSFPGALRANPRFEAVVSQSNREIDNANIIPIPWKQYHRANIPHLGRRST